MQKIMIEVQLGQWFGCTQREYKEYPMSSTLNKGNEHRLSPRLSFRRL